MLFAPIPVAISVSLPAETAQVHLVEASLTAASSKTLPGACGGFVFNSSVGFPAYAPKSKEVSLKGKAGRANLLFTGSVERGFCAYEPENLTVKLTVGDDPTLVTLNVDFLMADGSGVSADVQTLPCIYDGIFKTYVCNPYAAKGNTSNVHYVNRDKGQDVQYRFDLELLAK
jgi:hypothetical protein